MFVANTFITPDGLINVQLLRGSIFAVSIKIPVQVILDNIHDIKFKYNDIVYYVHIEQDDIDTQYFNSYFMDSNKNIISHSFLISPYNSTTTELGFNENTVVEDDKIEQASVTDVSETGSSYEPKNCRQITNLLKSTFNLNDKIEEAKKRAHEIENNKQQDTLNSIVSFASVTKSNIDNIDNNNNNNNNLVTSNNNDELTKYNNLITIFKSFVKNQVETSTRDSEDFKKYLIKRNLNTYIDLLEYNQSVIDYYLQNKENGILPDEPFYQWASNFLATNYLHENYPKYGVIFGEYSKSGYENRKFIVYKLIDTERQSFPKMAREEEFYTSEKNKAIKIILDNINNLSNDFEEFELKDIPELRCMLDILNIKDIKDAVMADFVNRDNVYIKFGQRFPNTPIVMPNKY